MSKTKDRDSWRYGGVKRRDFRATHDGPEVPPHRRKRNPKLRKWCRRVEGRQHILVRVEKYYGYSVDRCSVCGKNVNYFWRRPWVSIVREQNGETED